MKDFLCLLASLCLFIASPVFAEENSIAENDRAAIQLALDHGLAIRNYDQAAWHTTDTLREDIKDLNGSGIQGWVVTETENGWLTTFWRPEGDSFVGVYSAVWTGKKVIDRRVLRENEIILSGEQITLINAGKIADPGKLQRCKDYPFNTVVLPTTADDDTIYVYYLTPQTINDSIPLGGHYRIAVKDGKVTGQRAFMKSCFEMPIKPETEAGDTPVGFVITHLLDPVPTEIHVFSVYSAKAPIFVSTISNKQTWVVEVSGGQPRVRKAE